MDHNTTNTTSLMTSKRFNVFDAAFLNISFKILYAVTILCGLIANLSILHIKRTARLTKTKFTYLLTHLVMTDLLTGLSLIPYVFIDVHTFNITHDFEGSILCWATLGLSLFYTSAANQVLFLCVMTIFRLFSIKWPVIANRYMTESKIKKIIFGIWFLNCLTTIPNMLSWKFIREHGYCKRHWGKPIYGVLYTGLIFGIGIFIPITVFIASNKMISKTLRTHNKTTSIKDSAVERATTRITYLLNILFLVYIICWLPLLFYFFLATVTKLYPNTVEGDRLRIKTIRVCVLVNALNTVLDPVFFCYQLPDYKKAMKKLFYLQSVEPTTTMELKPRKTILVSTRQSTIN